MSTNPHTVGEILDCLDALADEHEEASVDHVLHAFGTRTFGPAIMVPALLELTPVGAIPGVPSFLAVTVSLVAAQKMLGRKSLWIPGLIGNRCVSADKLRKAAEKLRPVARFMDRFFHRRLKWLTHAPFSLIAAGLVILLSLTVPFLEVLPFASSVPMLAIAMFGLSVLVRDGVLMIAALAISLGTVAVGFDYLDGGMSDTSATDGAVTPERIEAVETSAKAAGEAIENTAKGAGETVKEAAEAASETASGAVKGD